MFFSGRVPSTRGTHTTEMAFHKRTGHIFKNDALPFLILGPITINEGFLIM